MDTELPWLTVTAYADELQPGADPDEPCARIAMSDNLRAEEQVRLARQVAALATAWAAEVERWQARQSA